MRTNVRRRLNYTDPKVGELARDIDEALGDFSETAFVKLTDVYQEPMVIGFDHEPEGVIALRVREDTAPETEVAVSATVPFVFKNKAVNITAIEGCTVGTRYRFTLWMVG